MRRGKRAVVSRSVSHNWQLSGWDAAIRVWLVRALPVAAAAGLAAAIVTLTSSPAMATCAQDFTSPQALADAIHSEGGVAFVGVVRQHWFATSLVEVQRTWQGRPPSRFVAVGPCRGDECRIRDLTVGRSYLFWVGAAQVPMYEFSCDRPYDADPRVIALLGPGADAPAFGPVDLLVMAAFVWWSAYVLVAPVIAAVVIGVIATLNQKWSTR